MSPKPTQSPIALWILALLLAAVFARLGFWQLSRGEEKREQIAASNEVLESRQSVGLLDPSNQAYSWAEGEGRFRQSPIILLDNQQSKGRVGVRAYALLEPAQDASKLMLVELGWLPMGGDRVWPQVEVPVGTVKVKGLRAAPPSAGISVGKAGEGVVLAGNRALVINLSPADITRDLKLDRPLWPQVLRLDPSVPFGYERDLEILPNTLPPEKHLGYAVQWFGLSITVLIIALLLSWRAWRKRRFFDKNTPTH